jgi:intracellular multiplication protein IcmP
MAVMIYYVWFRGPTSWFRKVFKLDDLIKKQAQTFKVIQPIINFNPSEANHRPPGSPVPAILPLFAEALSPEEWLAFHKIPIVDDKIDRDDMQRAFQLQLMGKWQGAGKLPPYLQVLLAAFALKTVRKRDEADDILGRIAGCWDHKKGLQLSREKGLVSRARKILKDPKISEKIIRECNRHAFITTAMLGALKLARSEGGVLAPAQFVWLRGHERTLWYPLNNLGRQSFHAEAMGAMSHFRAESMVQRPIPKPMMQGAMETMEDYAKTLRENNVPIPPLDFSMVKNKKATAKNKGILKPAGT